VETSSISMLHELTSMTRALGEIFPFVVLAILGGLFIGFLFEALGDRFFK